MIAPDFWWWICGVALVFTVVPPSSNPASKLNRDLQQALDLHVEQLQVQQGRMRFATTASHTQWPAVLSTARSLRWVVAECQNEVTPTDDAASVAAKLEAHLDHISQEDILDVYESFGNVLSADNDKMTFDLSCKRWASCVIPHISTVALSHALRRVVAQQYDWKPHRRADLSFHVILHDTSCVLELILWVPAAYTAELPSPGCKRVEAWMLVQSAQIQDGDTVLDPLCGKGTFLVEAAAVATTDQVFMGVDQSPQQLADARQNVQATSSQDRVELRQGDARCLDFLENDSVDVILTCPPFGRQFGHDIASLDAFYRQCLAEWTRVLAPHGRLAILIDVPNAAAMIRALQDDHVWQLQVHRQAFRLGRLQATVLVAVKRTDRQPLLPPATVLPWEGRTPLTRAAWSRLRAASLPNLVPYKPN